MYATELYKMLEEKFCAPAWVIFPEVANATGGGIYRYADAVAMAVWPSRGLEIHGFEIKDSRSDWVSELKNPKKSESVQKYCDKWWVVVSNEQIIKEGELPPTWGLLAANGKKLKQIVQAPQLSPTPLDKSFVASILRRSHENISRRIGDVKSESYEKGLKDGIENGDTHTKRKIQRYQDNYKHLKEAVDEFQKKSGVEINRWEAGAIGKAVKKVLDLRRYDPIYDLTCAKNFVDSLSEQISKNISMFKKIQKEENHESINQD